MVKIFCILDGIGDRPCKKLNGLTPLEVAKTLNLDYFSARSNHGYVYALGEKIAPESDEAIMALLGYDPRKYYYGRGPLEAYGAGMEFKQGWLALRTNFSTVAPDGETIIDRRAGRTLTTKEAKEIEKTINEEIDLGYEFEFKATVGHRGVLIIKGNFSSNISNPDPAYKRIGKFGVAVIEKNLKVQKCRALDPQSKTSESAKIVNRFVDQTRNILKDHAVNKKRRKNYLLEANIILPRDAGTELPKLPKKNNWAAIVSMPLEIGITKLAGMNVLKFEYPETKKDIYLQLYEGLNKTIKESIKNLKERKYENYLIHFKETDIPGHDNKPLEKIKMIELIDNKFFGFIKELKDVELVVTGDHSTPCELMSHSADFVTLLHYGKGKKDLVDEFNETECINGKYGKMYGKDVIKK